MFAPNTHYSQMNFAVGRQFSSRLSPPVLLQLRDTRIGLFVDKTRGAHFVVRPEPTGTERRHFETIDLPGVSPRVFCLLFGLDIPLAMLPSVQQPAPSTPL